MAKYIFVTGGVLSSLGKGIFSASLAKLLKSYGSNVSLMKIDPYLNCDAGTLNPFEHGEVFVTQDGFECDLDIGNYERYLDVFAKKEQNLMMGSVYKSIIEKERHGDYLGKTIQLIPHATNEIKSRIKQAAKTTNCQILIIEIGGTVGDIESDVVLEAARQMKFEEEAENVSFFHLALVPTITTGEVKTKPIQHSTKSLLSRGITPDFLVARCDKPLTNSAKEKIAVFCNVREENVLHSPTVFSIYQLPYVLAEQQVHSKLSKRMNFELSENSTDKWAPLIEKQKQLSKEKQEVRIAVIGKYATSKDAYMSVFESLEHCAINCNVKLVADLIDSESLEKGKTNLEDYDGILVPGGFGGRGVEGKIQSVKYARENQVPYLGICYGLQIAIIESARNLLNYFDANSTEIDQNTTHPVIDILPEQKSIGNLGGTMRLGGFDVAITPNTLAHSLYHSEKIFKRFRHRYEINPEYVSEFTKSGWIFSGKDPVRTIMKIGELNGHPFFVGTQAHPEFDSRLDNPEPLYLGFVNAAKEYKNKKIKNERQP